MPEAVHWWRQDQGSKDVGVEAQPQYVISQVRVLTQPEIVYLHVRSQPTPFADLDMVLDPALDSLYAARALAGLTTTGPDIIRYYPTEGTSAGRASPLFNLEAGIAVEQGTPAVGESQVVTLPPYRCAALLLWGSLAHSE